MDQQPQSAEDQALMKEAAAEEMASMIAYLQNRASMLNAEVRLRDRRIAELETEVATLRHPAPHPEPTDAPA